MFLSRTPPAGSGYPRRHLVASFARIAAAACGAALGLLGSCGGEQIGVLDDGGRINEADGATCVDIEPSSYDQSCSQDSDCILIQTGVICPSCCPCPQGAVNKAGEARYQNQISQVSPYMGPPFNWECITASARCVGHSCTVCGDGIPGTIACSPDGGADSGGGPEASANEAGPDATGMEGGPDGAAVEAGADSAFGDAGGGGAG